MSSLAEQLSRRRGNYTLPSRNDRWKLSGGGEVASQQQQQQQQQHADAPPLCPTSEGIIKLCDPIVRMLHGITAYEVMGNSTQVVVVDVHAPLTVAFVAAHETKASSCALWDSHQHKFEGIITTKDYIHVLLHCDANPAEVEMLQGLSVRQWREKVSGQNGRFFMCSATVEDSLGSCLEKMFRHTVHRLAIVSEHDELGASSLVSILTLSQLNHYMCRALFSDEGDASGSLLLPPSAQDEPELAGTDGESPAPREDGGVRGAPVVGSYCSIFDVPLHCLSMVGKNRRAPVTMRMESTVGEALRALVEHHVQAVAVVDDSGIVIDVISRTDVMRLERNGFYDLGQTLRDALSFRVGGSIFVVHEDATIREIFLHFHRGGVKELFIVDAQSDVVVGQLGLAELLYFLYFGQPQLADADA